MARVFSGDAAGTSGSRKGGLDRAYLAIVAFLGLLDSVNVLTILQDAARRGQSMAIWRPIVLEATSGLAAVIACVVIYVALLRAPPGQVSWRRAALIHGAASVVFSLLHVSGMTLMRLAVYAALGLRYRTDLADLPYEYRKDLLAYLILAGIFWVFIRPSSRRAVDEPASPNPPPQTFDIIVGSRTIRPLVSEILALRGAGNYVEFTLADGRKPLMRTSLREMERALAPSGFVRTHRSWMVNAQRVRGLLPTGSGDFEVELDGGAKAPLSRRLPQALVRLRAGDTASSPSGPNL